MARYMFKVRYTTEGIGGVLKEGGKARLEAAREVTVSAGGKLVSFDFAFGDVDAYLVADFPSAAAAAKVAMTVSAAGGATIETVALLTPADIDKAAKGKAKYRKPGA